LAPGPSKRQKRTSRQSSFISSKCWRATTPGAAFLPSRAVNRQAAAPADSLTPRCKPSFPRAPRHTPRPIADGDHCGAGSDACRPRPSAAAPPRGALARPTPAAGRQRRPTRTTPAAARTSGPALCPGLPGASTGGPWITTRRRRDGRARRRVARRRTPRQRPGRFRPCRPSLPPRRSSTRRAWR
jgi:hypothetical protein